MRSTALAAPSIDSDLSSNLEQTARPYSRNGDFRWDGIWFDFVGMRRTNCSAFKCLDNEIAQSLRKHILQFANEQKQISNNTFVQWIESLRHMLATYPTKEFDETWVRKALTNDTFAKVRAISELFFLYWIERFRKAIKPEALQIIAKTRRPLVHNRNVLSDDPEKSWLTEDEYEALLRCIWMNYDEGNLSTQSTLLRLLSMQYARRPIQIAGLKISDFVEDGVDGTVDSGRRILFPGAKDINAEHHFRDSKVEVHPVADHLWNLFELQKNEIKELFENRLEIKLSEADTVRLPLFSAAYQIEKAVSVLTVHYGLDWKDHLDHRLFHLSRSATYHILDWSSHQAGRGNSRLSITPPISHRTGNPISVTATRLRHTRARQLARLGVPKHVLSFWLGHTKDCSLDAYYNDPAEEARKINESMGSALVPLALAFTGNLIDDESQASRADVPESRLEFANEGRLETVGNCGKYSFCATTSVPVPCYRCKHFEPLVYAPHDEVLQALLKRQDEERAMIRIGGNRKLLTPIDLSADIRAVRACIERCNARKQELEN
ncbi:site-specific integrase [Massilia putida]|uniref:site-specific integrase n=1 Tax=Massilia putida TaxID=1141883 RepID=UPI000B2E4B57|nr:site-specific integrase [Massilia putida]